MAFEHEWCIINEPFSVSCGAICILISVHFHSGKTVVERKSITQSFSLSRSFLPLFAIYLELVFID